MSIRVGGSAPLRVVAVAAFVVVLTALGHPGAAAAESPLERGTYLMQVVAACGNCHTTRDGAWSDDELVKAIREGLRPDGSLIGPPMPIEQYRGMSDGDVRAIVAYLRSVPAVRHRVERSEYRIPLPPAYGPPVERVAEVPREDPVAYGAYLAGPLAHCVECHTPMEEGHFDYENRLGAGGLEIPLGEGAVILSGNITPDVETGIGSWSDGDIKRAITHGERPDGSRIHPIMPYGFYAGMKDEDLDAIVAYLRTIPPVRNRLR
jgi:mono/diheme cytochrome c family protein